MKLSVKALLLATALVAVGTSVAVRAASDYGVTLPAKEQARMPSGFQYGTGRDTSSDLVQLAQAVRPQSPFGAGRMPPQGDEGMGPRPPHGPMADEPLAGPQPAMHMPPGPPPFDRASCEEGINRHAAMAGYIKSKLQLQGAQKEAWRKIEEAAEPAVAKLHQICAQLPVNAGPPPAMPDVLEMAAKQTAARAEFLQAVSGPARALYDTLSADQRAALVPPPPPPGPRGPF